MKVIVGFETSGTVREAFRALGHDAWSCDILPAQDNSPHHIQGDIRDVMHDAWDLGIFHPDCTYLTVSAAWAFSDPDYNKYPGVGYHQKIKSGTKVGAERRKAREDALQMVRDIMSLNYKHAIENPVGAISSHIRPADQYIQPYEYGHSASKKTGLWLKDLPLLTPTNRVKGRFVNGVERWDNQTDSGQNRLTPSDDRWQVRSNTYKGIAEAMAEQWGEK